jgi:Tfp pilus assembly protein PilN
LIKPKVGGLEGDSIQDYLIPLSMQLGELTEPADPTTLNLLPPQLVEKYKGAKLKVQTWSLTLTTTLFVWVSFFSVLATYLFFNQMIATAKNDPVALSPQSQKNQDLVNTITEINSVSQDVLKIKKIYHPPTKVLNEIHQARPAGVTINSYELDLDRGLIAIGGVSAGRSDLVEFKNNLEKNENFSEVILPISSLEAEADLQYKMSFTYQPISGKPKK